MNASDNSRVSDVITKIQLKMPSFCLKLLNQLFRRDKYYIAYNIVAYS